MIMVTVTIFICLAATTLLTQIDEAGTKSRAIAPEQLWNQAYESGDTKALDSILDDGIVLVNDDGSVQTKKEFLAS